jgi:hypothetical protein
MTVSDLMPIEEGASQKNQAFRPNASLRDILEM